jgi:hypothetical protein
MIVTLLYCDGFDTYATADILKRWNATSGSSGNSIGNPGSGRRSTGAMYVQYNNGWARRSLPAAKTGLVMGGAIYWSSSTSQTPFYSLMDGGSYQCTLLINSDGKIYVYRGFSTAVVGTTTVAVSLNAWNFIEWKVLFGASSTCSTIVRINGVEVLNLSNVNLMTTANARADAFLLGSTGSGTGGAGYIDDFYILDTTGTVNSDFLGDIRVDALLPTAAGTYQQFGVSGTTNHYAAVADLAPDTTTFLYSSTVGAKETQAMADLSNVTGSIKGVQVTNMVLKDDAGARSVANLILSGATESQGTSTALSTSQLGTSTVLENDPATGSAWDQAGINGIEAGVIVTG